MDNGLRNITELELCIREFIYAIFTFYPKDKIYQSLFASTVHIIFEKNERKKIYR